MNAASNNPLAVAVALLGCRKYIVRLRLLCLCETSNEYREQ